MLKLPEKLTPFDTFLPSTASYGYKRSLLQIKSASDNLVKIGFREDFSEKNTFLLKGIAQITPHSMQANWTTFPLLKSVKIKKCQNQFEQGYPKFGQCPK